MTEPTVHCDVCKSEIKPDSDGIRRYFRQRDYNVADGDPGFQVEWLVLGDPTPVERREFGYDSWSDVCGIGCLYRLLSDFNSAMQQERLRSLVGNGCERITLEAVDV